MASVTEQKRDETAYEPYRHHGNESDSTLRPLHSPPSDPMPRVIELRSNNSSRIKTLRIVLRGISAAISLAVVGIVASTIVNFEKTKNMRMVWPHGLALKAWSSEAKMTPTYLVLGAASLAALINILALFFGRLSQRASSWTAGNIVSIMSHLMVIAVWVAAFVVGSVVKPNLRSWGCENKAFETAEKDNTVGLSRTCVEATSTFVAGIIVAVVELINLMALFLTFRSSRVIYRNGKGKKSVYRPREYSKLDDEGQDRQDVPMLGVSRAAMT